MSSRESGSLEVVMCSAVRMEVLVVQSFPRGSHCTHAGSMTRVVEFLTFGIPSSVC